jgi:glycosyltransferase involved in cell wall biosynthesis
VGYFVAISRTVQRRIAECYGRDSVVIQPPVDVDFFTPASLPREGFYLVVSALVPYKRVEQAIWACGALGRELVVIGEGPERARLEHLAGNGVRFLGWQPDDVVRDHLRRCRALLFPGEEDFGIVPIEALACGAPVIAYGAGGVAETVNDAVGRLYEPGTAEGLRAAIERWESAGCPHDAAEGRRRAEAFARPRFRERLLTFLARVVAGEAQGAGRLSGPHWKRGIGRTPWWREGAAGPCALGKPSTDR